MRARRIDKNIHSLLLARAQDKSVVRSYHIMLVGLAAISAGVEQFADAGPDVLALMAFAARTLANEKAAMLAEVITPGIRVVARRALVEDQRPAVYLA
jgi:hypothetical protein